MHRKSSFLQISKAAPPAGLALALACVASPAIAQDGSLLDVPAALQKTTQNQGLTLENSSYIYRKVPPDRQLRELKIHDIIVVLVDYRTSMLTEGDAENRTTNNYNGFLNNWVKFDGKNLTPDPQPNGPLAISGNLQKQYRVESDMELRDQLTFRIASEIVDIRPNGNLVIEGHRTVQVNEEKWMQSLTGVVARTAIGPDRVVRSDEIVDLRIEKREMGFIRDSYKRGWLHLWYDHWKPF
jgi:flagellar L-ring protein precursor FlgH